MLVHGDNISSKEKDNKKYNNGNSRKYIAEIREKYNTWHEANMELKGPFIQDSESDTSIISKRVDLFNEYKDFVDQQVYAEHFDSRSNLHSSILEEFIYYLFKDIVSEFSEFALLGKSHAFKDIFFKATNYREMVAQPSVKIEHKDHDFIIGVNLESKIKCSGGNITENINFQIPCVAIECKTYLDKTMLEGASTAGQQLQARNPNAIYIVVAEWLKLTESINIKKYNVDQIYVLRKQKNTDREFRFSDNYIKNPIYEDVVLHLFEAVRSHLTTDWAGGVKNGLDKGYLL